MKLNRNEFIELMQKLDNLDVADGEFCKAISTAFDCFAVRYKPTEEYPSLIINLLEKMFEVPTHPQYGSDISYFVYDLDFGRAWKTGMVLDNGCNVDLSDAGKLYDYITKETLPLSQEIVMGC